MKERFGYLLPCQVGGKDVYLPDYVTVTLDNGTEVQVHPDRKDRFIEEQIKLGGIKR